MARDDIVDLEYQGIFKNTPSGKINTYLYCQYCLLVIGNDTGKDIAQILSYSKFEKKHNSKQSRKCSICKEPVNMNDYSRTIMRNYHSITELYELIKAGLPPGRKWIARNSLNLRKVLPKIIESQIYNYTPAIELN